MQKQLYQQNDSNESTRAGKSKNILVKFKSGNEEDYMKVPASWMYDHTIGSGHKLVLRRYQYRCQLAGYCARAEAEADAADYLDLNPSTVAKYSRELVSAGRIILASDQGRQIIIAHDDPKFFHQAVNMIMQRQQEQAAKKAERQVSRDAERVRRTEQATQILELAAKLQAGIFFDDGAENFASEAENFISEAGNDPAEAQNSAGNEDDFPKIAENFPSVPSEMGGELSSEASLESKNESTTETTSESCGQEAMQDDVVVDSDFNVSEQEEEKEQLDQEEVDPFDYSNDSQSANQSVSQQVNAADSGKPVVTQKQDTSDSQRRAALETPGNQPSHEDQRALADATKQAQTEFGAEAGRLGNIIAGMRQSGHTIAQVVDTMQATTRQTKSHAKDNAGGYYCQTLEGMANQRQQAAQEQARKEQDAAARRRENLNAAAGGEDGEAVIARYRLLDEIDKEEILAAAQEQARETLGFSWGAMGREQRRKAIAPYVVTQTLAWESQHA